MKRKRNIKKHQLLSLCLILTFFLIFAIAAQAGDPTKAGDVVGRNLFRFPHPITAWAGHVGIWTGNAVLEVTGIKEIAENPLSDFKKPFLGVVPVFWGAAYTGDGKLPLNKVVDAGRNQMDNYNFRYTFTAWYRAGGYSFQYTWNYKTFKWEKKRKKLEARFRCDTFVNYAYREGTGKHIRAMTERIIRPWDDWNIYTKSYEYYTNIKQFITPKKLWTTMPGKR